VRGFPTLPEEVPGKYVPCLCKNDLTPRPLCLLTPIPFWHVACTECSRPSLSWDLTNMLLHLHANSLQIQSHPLQCIDCHALSKFDPSQQQVFRSYLSVVEPLGLRERKRQDLFGTWSEILHDCIFDAGRPAASPY